MKCILRTTALALAIFSANCLAATVVTNDGTSYSGQVEFKDGNSLSVTPTGGAAVQVAIGDISRLDMNDAPAAAALTTQPSTQPSNLPAPWQHADIGSVRQPGNASLDGGVFTLTGAGWGIWGQNDSCHMVYQPFDGDADFIARIVDLPTNDNPAVAGITIRDGLNADGNEASVTAGPGSPAHLNSRPWTSLPPQNFAAGVEPPHWLRLIRSGTMFSAFTSTDGKTWLPCGGVNVTIKSQAVAALACGSFANMGLTTAKFDNVSLRVGSVGPSQGLQLVDGTRLAGLVQAIDDKNVTYISEPKAPAKTIALDKVALVFMRPLPTDAGSVVPAGKSGLVLTGADFMEGEIQGFANNNFSISSVVFGVNSIELPRVAIAILHDTIAPAAAYSLRTKDGSIYACKSITTAAGSVSADTASLGPVTVNAADVAGITHNSGK